MKGTWDLACESRICSDWAKTRQTYHIEGN